jgi:hypothetical protein
VAKPGKFAMTNTLRRSTTPAEYNGITMHLNVLVPIIKAKVPMTPPMVSV